MLNPKYMLIHRANSKTSAWIFQLMGCGASGPGIQPQTFPLSISLIRSETTCMVEEHFSLEVKLVCGFVSQICIQTLLQLERSSLIVTQIEGRSTILFHAAFQDENSSRNIRDKVQRSCPLVARVHPSCPFSKTCTSPAALSGLISALLGNQREPCAG